MARTIGLLLALAWFSAAGFAQSTADPMEQCWQLKDDSARLACFDHEMRRRHAAGTPAAAPTAPASMAGPASTAVAAATPAPAPAPVPAPAAIARPNPADDTVGLSGKELSLRQKAEGTAPAPIAPIVAALSRLRPQPGHLYYFELANGQLWESTDSLSDLFLKPNETVTIRPGVLGAFFLKTEEGNSIRVHRVR
jgi:hypothetical protein